MVFSPNTANSALKPKGSVYYLLLHKQFETTTSNPQLMYNFPRELSHWYGHQHPKLLITYIIPLAVNVLKPVLAILIRYLQTFVV